MSQLIVPGSKSIKGPWFLGLTELEELGHIFESIIEKITVSINEQIEKKASDYVQNGDFKEIKVARDFLNKTEKKKIEVTLLSNDGSKLIDQSLIAILKDSKLSYLKPVELILKLEHGFQEDFSLVISNENNGELNYKVNCFNNSYKDEIIFQLDKWIEKYKPNKVNQIWSDNRLILTISTIVLFISLSQKPFLFFISYKLYYQILFFSAFLMFISFKHPKTTIGIGKNTKLLKFYRFYTKTILITTPGLFILPQIIGLINKLIWG